MQQHQQTWHRHVWLLLAVLFGALIVMRMFGLEEIIRDGLRTLLRGEGSYQQRQAIQRPLVSFILVLFTALLSFLAFRFLRQIRGRRNYASAAGAGAGLAMILLLLLRITSLHVVDKVLYGPFRFNWIADVGITLVALGAAARYVMILRRGH
ncbi:MAG: hypothetical protein RIB52_00305 [Erythrobacter sp.]|uniref:hypothetical protein n=1 Tax=Erythrobacter sp. TaxID=1042 RepID=UPI0032EE25D2